MASERSVGLGIESVVDLDRVPWDRRRVPTNPVTEVPLTTALGFPAAMTPMSLAFRLPAPATRASGGIGF